MGGLKLRLHKFFRHRWLKYILILIGIIVIISITIFNKKISTIRNTVPLPTALDPNFITQVNDCFIPTAAIYGYTLRIVEGFFSMADQANLYQQGRTVNGHIVTYAQPGHSFHNYGFAVDVVDRYKGYNINWIRLIKIGAYCGLENGGVGDFPNFHYSGGLTTSDFAAGLRPPPLKLPCSIMAERAMAQQPLTLKDLKNCGAPKF